MKAVAETLGVSRSNLVERLAGGAKPLRRHQKAQDAAVLPQVARLVDARPTYAYRRTTALLNRDLGEQGLAPANHKRVYRLMKLHGLLLEKHGGRRPGRSHDGKVVVMRSDLRSPVGSNQWRLTGSLLGSPKSSVAPSSSTPTTLRSSPGAPPRTPEVRAITPPVRVTARTAPTSAT